MKRTLSYRDRQTRWLTENNINAKETRVIVKRGLEESDYEWELTWIMDNYIGAEGLIRDVKNIGIVVTFPNGDSFCFPYYVLEKVNDEKKEEKQNVVYNNRCNNIHYVSSRHRICPFFFRRNTAGNCCISKEPYSR